MAHQSRSADLRERQYMALFAITLRSNEMKEVRADSYHVGEGFFHFYEEPTSDSESSLKFSIAVLEVMSVEKI